MSSKIAPENSPWYCEDTPDEDRPLKFVPATESIPLVGVADVFEFSSLAKLKRGNPLTVAAVEVAFKDFADRPLGRPYAYLQVPKNGACFYSSLSLALEGHTGSNEAIRNVICDEMLAHQDRFLTISSSPCVPYATKQRRKNAWADHLDIVFACSAFSVKIDLWKRA